MSIPFRKVLMYAEKLSHFGQVPISVSTSIYRASTACLVQDLLFLCDVCLTISGEKEQKTQYLKKSSHVLPKQGCLSTLCKPAFSSFNSIY